MSSVLTRTRTFLACEISCHKLLTVFYFLQDATLRNCKHAETAYQDAIPLHRKKQVQIQLKSTLSISRIATVPQNPTLLNAVEELTQQRFR